MMKGSEGAATSTRGGGSGKGQRKKVPKFTQDDKENFDIYGGEVGVNENKSPLPVGYPRAPLQDITAVLLPSNNSDDEPSSGMRKPVTRSQNSRKLENVHTRILSESFSRNVVRSASNRGGLSKTRTKQVMKTVTQSKEEIIHHTVNISSSVKLTDQTEEGKKTEDSGETSVTAAEQTHASSSAGSVLITDKKDEARIMDVSEATPAETEQGRPAPEEQLEGSVPSTSGTGSQIFQEQKRRKPLSARSSVSSFR